ncbi:putative RhtB family transporter [Vibrio azureus NBRC 104587]|uniref:Putative RhtB family transporter n=2 Tax=Vibrio azureus TaxID=512649 RepID=U3AXS0_9VIBR|nr:putative RhtB family transporter [Vibrio azureus NBRC 104587]
MSPGPSLAVVAKHALSGGRINGLATAWAHAMGIAIYACLTLLGLAIVLHQSPIIFKTITILGALYLVYLGVNALRSKGGISEKLESGQATSVVKSAREGFFMAILSPKIAIFFTALFSQFISLDSPIGVKVTIVSLPFLIDGLWYTFVTMVLSDVRVVDKIRSKAGLIDKLTGVILILLAIRVIVMNM